MILIFLICTEPLTLNERQLKQLTAVQNRHLRYPHWITWQDKVPNTRVKCTFVGACLSQVELAQNKAIPRSKRCIYKLGTVRKATYYHSTSPWGNFLSIETRWPPCIFWGITLCHIVVYILFQWDNKWSPTDLYDRI